MPDLSKMSLSELASEYYCGTLEGSPEVLAEFRRRDEREKADAARLAMWPELVRAIEDAIDEMPNGTSRFTKLLARARELA